MLITGVRVIYRNGGVASMNKNIYKAFGFTIASDIVLPELPQDTEESQPDIVVIKVDLSHIWSKLSDGNRYFVVQKNFVMFQVPDVAIYLIKNGEEIFVSPINGVEEEHMRLFILGTCMGSILLQRKILPLHGSAIAINDKAYAIVGNSGAGKSTLAAAFLKKGYYLISDDLIPVILSEDNFPSVISAYPQQKLWLESINELGMDYENFRPLIKRRTKFAVPLSNNFATKQMPLAGVFELMTSESNMVEVEQIKDLDRLYVLFNHTYRNFLISRLGIMNWHFDMSVQLVSQTELYRLIRPRTRFTANELVDLILTKVNQEEKFV